MGEQEFRIFDVGAPQLDDIINRTFPAASIRLDGAALDQARPYILLVQHPVMAEVAAAGRHMRAGIEACLSTGLPVVWIYPNSDLGYTDITKVIAEFAGRPNLISVRNLDRDEFLSLLANAAVLVGNSSSGILEAPSFHTPVVNIGNRQRGRQQAGNILNCGYGRDDIAGAVRRALSDAAFRAACAAAVNPYGDGKSGRRICELLRDIAIDAALLDKQTTY
jgi:UDP-hydrolysing UDP-N-acetyl-D-glucosamine 2-epimerase